MELELSLDPDSKTSLQSQIFEQIRYLILSGVLKTHMALPSSRCIAERFAVSRNTVTLAYDRLSAEGYIQSRGTAGTFVGKVIPDHTLFVSGDEDAPNGTYSEDDTSPVLCFAGTPGGGRSRPVVDFWVGRSDPAEFPIKLWRSLVNRRLCNGQSFLTDYCDPAGLPQLREGIASHLARTRGMSISSDQVVVTAGGQDALNLVCQLVDARTSRLCIENPCYQGAALVFQSSSKDLRPIPVDGEGLRVDFLPKEKGSLLYVTPSHQFPTGVTLSLTRRLLLLQWAEETDSLIIEDDYDSDFRHDGPPLTSLAGLDRSRRVFYAGTFSKSVGAGLRIGYTVVPRQYRDKARLLKAQMSNGQSWLEQAALADFLQEGHFDRHLRRLRKVYKSRRDCLVDTLNDMFDKPILSGMNSGLHLIWRLPAGSPAASRIQIEARSMGLGVYALKSGAAFDFDQSAQDDALMFGYSSVPEEKIVEAIGQLKRLIGRATVTSRSAPARDSVCEGELHQNGCR